MNPNCHILIVENDLQWRDALTTFYRRVFKDPWIEPAGDADEALRLILRRGSEAKEKPYDLVSLDLHLGERLGKGKSGNGKALLQEIARKKLARFAVIVTQAYELPAKYFDCTDEMDRAKSCLSTELRQIFPHTELIHKGGLDPEKWVDLQYHSIGEVLREALFGLNVLERVKDNHWKIHFQGRTITIKSVACHQLCSLLCEPDRHFNPSDLSLSLPGASQWDVEGIDQIFSKTSSTLSPSLELKALKKGKEALAEAIVSATIPEKKLELKEKLKRIQERVATLEDQLQNAAPRKQEADKIRQRLKNILKRIKQYDPELGTHLEASIKNAHGEWWYEPEKETRWVYRP